MRCHALPCAASTFYNFDSFKKYFGFGCGTGQLLTFGQFGPLLSSSSFIAFPTKPCQSAKTPLRLKVRPHAMLFPSKPCSLKWSSPVVSSIDRSSLKHPGELDLTSGKDQCAKRCEVVRPSNPKHTWHTRKFQSHGTDPGETVQVQEPSQPNVAPTVCRGRHRKWIWCSVQHDPKAGKTIKVQQSYVVGKRAQGSLNCKIIEMLSRTLWCHLLILADSSACSFCDTWPWPTFSLSVFTVLFWYVCCCHFVKNSTESIAITTVESHSSVATSTQVLCL